MTAVARHFLEVDDLTAGELAEVLDLAEEPHPPAVMAGRGMALLFEKPSLRTRHATEMAVVQLGGHPLTLRGEEVSLESREPVADVARVLSAYHAVVGARVFAHRTVEALARAASVPVVNLLSDASHPCQALADLLTLRQHFGELKGLTVAYVGDHNNVARSLSLAAAMAGAAVRLACPPGHAPSAADLDRLAAVVGAGADVAVTARPAEAASGADVVYTDVWTSMGQEAETAARRCAFEGFTVDETLMAEAASGAVFLHCLPAHRGEEVAAGVIDGPASLVWRQAENRMHATRGLLRWLLAPARALAGGA